MFGAGYCDTFRGGSKWGELQGRPPFKYTNGVQRLHSAMFVLVTSLCLAFSGVILKWTLF